jgi:hypothetical protein
MMFLDKQIHYNFNTSRNEYCLYKKEYYVRIF